MLAALSAADDPLAGTLQIQAEPTLIRPVQPSDAASQVGVAHMLNANGLPAAASNHFARALELCPTAAPATELCPPAEELVPPAELRLLPTGTSRALPLIVAF